MSLPPPGMAACALAALDPVPNTRWRTRNLGALLFAATDVSVRDKLRVMRAGGFGAISEAQLTLFHHLDHEGTRMTAIAARAGVTKQAMIELVDRAEALRLIERQSDPEDRRVRIVRPTASGLTLLGTLERGIALAEANVAAIVGENFLVEMKDRLGAYAVMPTDAVLVTTGAPWRARSIGRLTAMSARRFAAEALAAACRQRRRNVPEVLLALFRNLDLGGTRLTDIAARARMTKQSMRELVDRAEALGFIARRPDPHDRRAKVIRFTPSGLSVLDNLREGVEWAEEAFGRVAGMAFTAQLKAKLLDYLAAPDTPRS